MRTIIATLILFFMVEMVMGQKMSRHQADSLLSIVTEVNASTKGVAIALKLANFYIRKSGSAKPDLDSAVLFIDRAKKLHPSFNSPWADGYILLIEARFAEKNGRKAHGKTLNFQAMNFLKLTGDTILYGKACYELSRYYTDINDTIQLKVRVSLVEKAIALLRRSPDQIDLAADMLMLADLYQQQSKYKKSFEFAEPVLALLRSLHQELQGVYILMCTDELWLGNYQQALNYGLLAITASEQVHEKKGRQRLQIENTVAVAYHYLRNWPKAIEHAKTALNIAIEFPDSSAIFPVAQILSRAYLANHQPQKVVSLLNNMVTRFSAKSNFSFEYTDQVLYLQAYLDLKDFNKATTCYDYCKVIVNDPRVPELHKDRIYLTLIAYEETFKNYKASYSDLVIYAMLAEKYHNNFKRQESYREHAKLDSLTNNYKSAFTYSRKYQRLSDSLLNDDKDKQLEELEVIFRIKQKDNSIELLHQNAKLRYVAINRSRRKINETIAGIFLILIGWGFFTRHYRIRQKTFRIISKQNSLIVSKSQEISTKNQKLEGLIQEKEFLLMEVHHRVKNNLHTVLSFLSLQARYLEGEALEAVKISQQRIYAMSLIHQKLYLADDVKTIDIKSYLNEFITYFKECLSPEVSIQFLLKVDPIRLPVTKAISIGLIINEAITNSAKYAFAGGKGNIISISLNNRGDKIELLIADNGVGALRDLNLAEFDSLGIKLIRGLTNDLGGAVRFKSINGVSISICFDADL